MIGTAINLCLLVNWADAEKAFIPMTFAHMQKGEKMADLINREDTLEKITDAISKYIPMLEGDAIKIPLDVARAVINIPSAESVKAYTKADYIMALHKEYGCTLTMAEEAHNKALEYLQSKARMKG